jgi:predicted alpha/beta hydrolase family esterase
MKHLNIEHKKILFAHSSGGQGSPGEGSYDLVSYLKKELSGENEIHYPIIDDPDAPTYKMWKKLLSTEFKTINQPVILVGHSLGGSMLLKYLSEERPQITILALFLVSTPLWGKNGWDVEDFVLQENFESELRHINKVFLYHCKEDAIVPFEHLNFYKRAFPNSTVRVLNGTDHAFADGLPELVDDIRAINRG